MGLALSFVLSGYYLGMLGDRLNLKAIDVEERTQTRELTQQRNN